jgi:hypothetical protein
VSYSRMTRSDLERAEALVEAFDDALRAALDSTMADGNRFKAVTTQALGELSGRAHDLNQFIAGFRTF